MRLVGVLLTSVLAITGCASPALIPKPPVQHPPQPAFSQSAPAIAPEDPSTVVTNAVAITASYADPGESFDTSRLLNASQGGYAPMRNLHWLTGQAAQMSSMGLKDIRIDHVFDDPFYNVVSVDAAGAVQYDFSRLDQVLLPLVAHDITPLISLSYTPGAFADSPYAPPGSLEAWSALVTSFVSHYRDLGHTGWEYEVWNEVDTLHWEGTSAEYNALYQASATAVKSADATARIGGPAAADLNSPGAWSKKFIDFIAANPAVPVDFFTVHSYRAAGWETVTQAREWLTAAGLAALPIYVTEWNNDSFMDKGPGQGSDSNSSINGSSYTARRLFLASQTDAEKFFYFSPVEGLQFDRPYNGDLGLVTVDGHRKAVGNVFEMFSELESTSLPTTVVGPGSETQSVYGLVTKDTADKTATAILWNNTTSDAEVALEVTDLPYAKTNFTSTVSVVSAARGNGFGDEQLVVAPAYPSANENAAVADVTVHAAADILSQSVRVPAYGVVLVAVTPTDEKAGVKPTSAEPASTNIASSTFGAVASASTSVEEPANGWAVAGLNDGRRHSFEPASNSVRGWTSASHPNADAAESVQIDLGSSRPVDTVVLWPRDSQVSDGRGFPDTFTIQGSADGVTWTTLHDAESYNKGQPVTGAQTFGFPAAEYRYLKVDASVLTSTTAEAPDYSFQLAEFEAYRNGHENGGFETGTLDGWKSQGDAEVQSAVVRGGNGAVIMTGEGSGISTSVTGLLPNTTYTFGAHVKPSGKNGSVALEVSDFGSKAKSVSAVSDQWESFWVTFTTGPKNTSAELSLSVTSGKKSVWVDDFLITQAAE